MDTAKLRGNLIRFDQWDGTYLPLMILRAAWYTQKILARGGLWETV
jgi:hypothetical protein